MFATEEDRELVQVHNRWRGQIARYWFARVPRWELSAQKHLLCSVAQARFIPFFTLVRVAKQ